MNKIIQFFKEVRVELTKVVWPTKREALKATGIVILFSLIVSIFLGLIDFGLTKLLGFLVEK
ncbi:MAG: preprotein translocase subunit SecE [bacterium]|nr:preprotein translocase subunit SecE [bacterium]